MKLKFLDLISFAADNASGSRSKEYNFALLPILLIISLLCPPLPKVQSTYIPFLSVRRWSIDSLSKTGECLILQSHKSFFDVNFS